MSDLENLEESTGFFEGKNVHYHRKDDPYENHGAHGEPAYFLIDEEG